MKFVYFWFRRDLRDQDQVGFYQALKSGFPVRPIFIFDQQILSRVVDSSDARVTFIYDEVLKLKQKFQELGSDLIVQYGDPVEIWSELCQDPELQGIYCNHDHEPYPQWRDRQVQKKASEKNIPFHSFKDISIFERSEILTGQGTVYSVYTAYKNKWLQTLTQKDLYFYDCQKQIQNLDHFTAPSMPSLQKIGFQRSGLKIPSNAVSVSCLQNYHLERDIPSLDSTSHLGIHLRFGTVSVRQMVLFAQKHSSVWLSELIWREFFMQILFHYPEVVKKSFRPGFDDLPWRWEPSEFQRWKDGQTGYPLVDAGMRQLAQTGQMHNRVRMVTASFLTKHLAHHWHHGERYFAEKLLDYDLSANNGNWQWVAGTGCDAAPYFRIFNPSLQSKRFDPDNEYVKKWVPEWGTSRYPDPMVNHQEATRRCLQIFSGLKKK